MKFAAVAVAAAMLGLGHAYAMEPFGLDAVPSQSADLIVIWRALRLELASDQAEITLCRREQACASPVAKRFIAIVDEARRYGGRQMIGHLNRSINAAIPTTRANVP